ncbi:DUF3006 family protein [Anaerocolumna sedimenticola]|uniref:DUF3006 family protein n=1 Tax=Anaerocolumna sedimenticola TaxID=2696063 RepID=A0A6P1TQY1_9FIRM|nr:DUF3006 domain-containing protein [Anaerocolumna sedimenticola]QHQ62757.1 DUF3006 family protein [Anaerocolumna sedimenticola]
MEKLIIDRFEEEFAVCEKEDRTMIDIPRSSLPQGVTEGSCIIITDNGTIKEDQEEYLKRKEEIARLLEELAE